MATIILDPYWRSMDELFSPAAQDRLKQHEVIWGKDDPIPEDVLGEALPNAEFLVSANPIITRETLENAPNLRAVVEVSGAFPGTIDYAACAAHGVEVLSCAPGFRSAVAEMGLAMTLGVTRGLVREHEAFRNGNERWLEDCGETDFTFFGAKVGFVGFGQIAQEMTRLLAPFQLQISAYDPWLPSTVAARFGVELTDLKTLAARSQVLYVTAVPTADNHGLINAEILSEMSDQSVLVILSRAHLVDFDAVMDEAQSGRLSIATDVFPSEPIDADHPIRRLPNVLLSPHRAAAVAGGRHLIGELLLQDISAICEGSDERQLLPATPERIKSLADTDDAKMVSDMATARN